MGNRRPARSAMHGRRQLQRAFAEQLLTQAAIGPMLDRMLTGATRLLNAAGSSISLVEEGADSYRKVADLHVACRAGQIFPLDEGVTGQVVVRRRPVLLDDYGSVPAGHLPPEDPAARGGVLGVPIWWRDTVIGVHVVFAGPGDRFSPADADQLEELVQVEGVALRAAHHNGGDAATRPCHMTDDERAAATRTLAGVLLELRAAEDELERQQLPPSSRSALHRALRRAAAGVDEGLSALRHSARAGPPVIPDDLPLAELLWRGSSWATRGGRIQVRVPVAGEARKVAPEVRAAVTRIAGEAVTNAAVHGEPSLLRLGLVYGPDGLTLLILDDGKGFDPAGSAAVEGGARGGLRRMADEARAVDGRLSTESIPGWGTVVRAELPYAKPCRPDTDGWREEPGPDALTPREHNVLTLVAQGLTDREIADLLALSPKTIEKHVGSVLRKTAARNRTEAVARAVDHGWIRH